ncbi:MAG: hypothetical protein Q7S25_01790 [Candidatus Limnocylindria bacterium]|nr:hypothetical protein [Candidatus Limnocylindria bacterium]
MGLLDVAFPYRAHRQFGAASFAFVFLVLLAEIELLTLAGFLLAGQLRLFLPFQNLFFPASILVSLAAAGAFTLRARAWTRRRLRSLDEYGAGASAFGERLARRSRG